MFGGGRVSSCQQVVRRGIEKVTYQDVTGISENRPQRGLEERSVGRGYGTRLTGLHEGDTTVGGYATTV
jgi:hypothetical protein